MNFKKAILATLATATLSVAAFNAQAAGKEVNKVIYSCDNSKTLQVVYINSGKNSYAVINQMDEMVPMKLMRSASGANYKAISSDYTYKLYTKGKNAELVEGNDKPVLSNCSL